MVILKSLNRCSTSKCIWRSPCHQGSHSLSMFVLFSVSMLFTLGFLGQPSFAADANFFCGISPEGTPTTYAKTKVGDRPVIRWVSQALAGYPPLRRCQEVSGRFQTYRNNGSLRYITTGFMNSQPVVCVSSQDGGGCQGLLFTLRPGENPSRVVQQLFDIGAGRASGPLTESSNTSSQLSTISIDFYQLLNSRPVEVSQPLTASSQAPTTRPRSPDYSGNGRIW